MQELILHVAAELHAAQGGPMAAHTTVNVCPSVLGSTPEQIGGLRMLNSQQDLCLQREFLSEDAHLCTK